MLSFRKFAQRLVCSRTSGPASVAPATGTTTRKADGTECAHVLRFDWESGSWLPETIEIPQLGTGTAELSEGLKVLIGAGTNMDKCRDLSTDNQIMETIKYGQKFGTVL